MTSPRRISDFTDERGRDWSAGLLREEGPDYKGRYQLLFFRGEDRAPLDDVRWNSEGSARRTLETMSEGELRRRLKIALGRRHLPLRPLPSQPEPAEARR